MADPEPPFEQRLRAEGAEQRDLHGGGHDPPDAEAAGEGSVNLAKQALRGFTPENAAASEMDILSCGLLRPISSYMFGRRTEASQC